MSFDKGPGCGSELDWDGKRRGRRERGLQKLEARVMLLKHALLTESIGHRLIDMN